MVILHITDILKVEGNGVGVAVKDYASKEKKFANIAIYFIGFIFIIVYNNI